MDPPPPPRPVTVEAQSETSPPTPSAAKLRLMCSYGGHIVPRPHDKSLFYAGGETRIVAVDRRTTAASLSAFTSHLSRSLYGNRQFALKYQLPNEDLDSLISVTADEDLHNMIEEHDRIASSPKPSRIRLFLFPSKAESVGSVLLDPKSESWFCDALKNTKIMQRGQSAEAGLVQGLMDLDCAGQIDPFVEANVENSSYSGEPKQGLDLGSMPESLVLETSSSFGSSGSSISMSNLPPIGVHGEDGGVGMLDRKVRVPSSASIESDNATTTAFLPPHIGNYQEPLVHVASMGTTVSSETIGAESMMADPSSGIQYLKPIQVPGYQYPPPLAERQHPQEVQHVQAGVHYIPQYATSQLPASSYYPMYHPPMHQSHYPPNPPYPIYLLPVRQPQPYNMSMQYNLVETGAVGSGQVPLQAQAAMTTHPVAYKELRTAPLIPELPGKVYRAVPEATAPVNTNAQQSVGPPELHHPPQSVGVASSAAATYDDDFVDNIAYTQIYKSQPPAPALPHQYQTMTQATAVQLSEASTVLHMDNVKQPTGTSPQPQ